MLSEYAAKLNYMLPLALAAAAAADPAALFLPERSIAAVFLAWGLYRLVEDFESRHEKRALFSGGRFVLDDLPSRPDAVYVGDGFLWKRGHTEKLLELEREGKLLSVSDDLGGIAALHGVGGGRDDQIFLPAAELEGHMFVCGTTRSGKTRFAEIIAVQAIRRGETVIIFDPKHDSALLDRVYSESRRASKELTLIAPPYPHISASYDPLRNFNHVNELADRIAGLLPAEGQSRPFKEFSWKVVNAVVEAMMLAGEQPTLDKIRRYSFISMQELASKLPPSREREYLENLIRHPKDHFSKMISSLEPLLAKLTSSDLKRLLSPEVPDLDWVRAFNEKMIVYMDLGALILQETAYGLGAMALQDLIAAIGKGYAYGKKKLNVTLIIDEFHNLVRGGWIGAVDLLNKAGGAGVKVAILCQSVADLSANLGRERAQQILDNTNVKVFFRASDAETAKKFSEAAGQVLLKTYHESSSVSPSPTDEEGAVFHVSYSRQNREQLHDLIRPSFLLAQPRGQAFLYAGGKTYHVRVPLLEPPPLSFDLKLE